MPDRLHVTPPIPNVLRVAAFILVLAGCGGQTSSPATAADSATSSPTAIPVPTRIHIERFSGGAGAYQHVAAFDVDRGTAATVPLLYATTLALPPARQRFCANYRGGGDLVTYLSGAQVVLQAVLPYLGCLHVVLPGSGGCRDRTVQFDQQLAAVLGGLLPPITDNSAAPGTPVAPPIPPDFPQVQQTCA